MKKVFKLAWGIITKPASTFENIKQEKPFGAGLLIFLFAYGLVMINSFIFIDKSILEIYRSFPRFYLFGIGSIAIVLILSFLSLLLGVTILNLFAKLFKGKGSFTNLLICFLFISTVNIVTFPLNLLSAVLQLKMLISILAIGVHIWILVLLIIAIKTIYRFNILKSVATYAVSLGLILIVVVSPLGLIYHGIDKNVSNFLKASGFDKDFQSDIKHTAFKLFRSSFHSLFPVDFQSDIKYLVLVQKYMDLKVNLHLREPKVRYSERDYWKTIVDYRQFAEKYPDSLWTAFVRSDMAEIYWQGLKEKEKAIEEYQEIIQDYPDSWHAAVAQYSIAAIYRDLKDHDQALTAYQKVITDYPESNYASMAQDSIGAIYFYNFKDFPKAIEEYRKVVENYPRSKEADYAQYKIGRLYQRQLEDYAQAIKEYQKVIKNYPDSMWAPWAQMKIGDTYYRNLNQKEQAIKTYQEVIKRYPTASKALEAQIAIGDIYSNLGEKEKALQIYHKAEKMYQNTFVLRLKGTEMKAHLIAGDLYAHKLGDYDRAMKVYQRLLKKDPQNIYASAAHMGLGECYEYQGNYRQALREYKKVIDDYPKGTRTHAAKLKVEIFSNNPRPLLEIYTQEYKYWRSGQYEKALEKCREILKKHPKSHLAGNAQYFIAFMYDYNLNNPEQALKEYQKLLEKYPESRWIKAAKQQIDSLKAEINKNK